MRPLKIEMHYFGPYEDAAIDFTKFEKCSLFLVAGNTGAGKTTIFDAICYALFGQTTNEKDRSAAALRSDFAPADQETTVTFTFYHQGKTYQVKRRPKQDLVGRRGRTVERNQAVQLIYPLESDQPTEITKIKEADLFITKLLNLTRDQFRQVVLLPQGKFRQFLDSDSNTKAALLRDLFNTAVYDRWAQKLKDQLASRKREMAEQATKLLTLKENVPDIDAQLSNDEWQATVAKRVEKLRQRLVTLNLEEEKQQSRVNRLTKQVHGEQDLQQQLIELAAAKKAQTRLTAAHDQIARQQLEAANLHWFQAHQTGYQRWLDGQQTLADQQKQMSKLQDRQAELAATQEKSRQAYQQLAELQPVMEKQRDQARELRQKLPVFAEYQRLTRRVEKAKKRLAAAQKQQLALQKSIDQAEKQIQQLTSLLDSRGDLAAKELKLLKQQQSQDNLVKMDQQLSKQLTDQQATAREQQQLTDDVRQQAVLVAKQTDQFAKLTDAAARYQIARLAAKLRPGSPCPVCGAVDHPHPAQPGHQGAMVTDKQLQSARDDLQACRDKLSQLREQLRQSQQRLMTGQGAITDLQAKVAEQLGRTKLPDDWNDQIMQRSQRLTDKRRELDRQQEAARREQQQLEELKQRLSDGQAANKQAGDVVQQCQRDLVEGQATLAAKQVDLPVGYPDQEAALQQVSRWQQAVTAFKEQLTAADQRSQKITRDLAVTRSSLKTVQAAQASLQQQQSTLHQQLLTALKEYDSTAGWEFWEQAQQRLSQLADLEGTIRDYQTRLHDNQEQIDRLTSAIAGRSMPDLANTQAALQKAQQGLRDHQQLMGQVQAQQKQLVTAQQKVAKIVRANAHQATALNDLQTLVDVVTGSTESHIGLERYVLQAYFKEVLAAANVQLARLTNDRYQFEIDQGHHGAGTKWNGLEVNVYDDNAGKTRSARTLSGGESFMASLALALALCQIIQEQRGGISIDALFIDEGFGSLDQAALTDALRSLEELEGHRMIGIISHVTELEEQIPDQLVVTSVNGRSHVSYRHDIRA